MSTLINFCKLALSKRRSVVVFSKDQALTLVMLHQYFPNHVMSLVDDYGIRIYTERYKNE